MARYAHVFDGIVVEIIDTGNKNIHTMYHKDVVSRCIKSSTASVGDRYINGKFVKLTDEELAIEEATTLPNITIKQLILTLISEGIITEEEGLLWSSRNGIPAFISNIIDSLPTNEQNIAKITVLTMLTAERTDPLIESIIGTNLGDNITNETVNNFWKKALTK